MTKTPPSKSVATAAKPFRLLGNDRETLTRLSIAIAFQLHLSPLCPRILAICLFRHFFVHKIVVNIYNIHSKHGSILTKFNESVTSSFDIFLWVIFKS
jgi:hypothetical protein